MLTITGIVKYVSKPKPIIKFRRVNYLQDRRARARESGKCGTCTVRYPSPNMKTCDVCINNRKKRMVK